MGNLYLKSIAGFWNNIEWFEIAYLESIKIGLTFFEEKPKLGFVFLFYIVALCGLLPIYITKFPLVKKLVDIQ